MITIAVDVASGDGSCQVAIDGLALIASRCTDVSFLLYGPERDIAYLLKNDSALAAISSIVDTNQVVPNDMKPVTALRTMQNSSMSRALQAVKNKVADGAVSSGNTGAYLALSKSILGTLQDIKRPAIASQIPTAVGESVMLDLGANVNCDERNIVEFAFMGWVFAKEVLKISNPSVGIINVGSEDSKGHNVLRLASELLQKTKINYHGFIEGDDIAKGTVNVIVCDGFAGNVALKTGEGVMRLIFNAISKTLRSSWRGKIAYFIARDLFQEIKILFDPRKYNGAIWLGLNGIAVKSHGGSDAIGFAHAVEMVIDMVKADINNKVANSISSISGIFAKNFEQSSQNVQNFAQNLAQSAQRDE